MPNIFGSIDRTLSDATTMDQNGSGNDGSEGVSTFPKAPTLLKPQHQIVLYGI